MLLSLFSSLFGEAETVETIYKHNTKHHNQYCRPKNEDSNSDEYMTMITIITSIVTNNYKINNY